MRVLAPHALRVARVLLFAVSALPSPTVAAPSPVLPGYLREAEEHLEHCRLLEAVTILEREEQDLGSLPPGLRSEVSLRLAELSRRALRPQAARHLLDLVQTMGPIAEARADRLEAHLAADRGDLGAALALLDVAAGRLEDSEAAALESVKVRLARARLLATVGRMAEARSGLQVGLDRLDDSEEARLLRDELLAELGGLDLAEGRFEAAEQQLLAAARHADQTAPASLLSARIHLGLAELYHGRGDPRESEMLAAAEVAITASGPCSAEAADLFQALSRRSLVQEFPAEAEGYLRHAGEVLAQLPGSEDRLSEVRFQRAAIAIDRSDYLQALEILDSAIERIRRRSEDHLDLPGYLRIAAVAAMRVGDYQGADQRLSEALRVVRSTAPVSWDAAACWSTLGELRRRQGRLEGARSALLSMAGVLDSLEEVQAGSEMSKAGYAFSVRGHRRALVRLLLRRGEVAKALAELENSMTRVYRFPDARPPSRLEDIRSRLDPGQAVVWIVVGWSDVPRSMWGDQPSFVVALGPGSAEPVAVEIGPEFVERLDFASFRRAILESRHAVRAAALVRRRSLELTRLLLEPVAGALEGADSVLFVGDVEQLPVAALLDPATLRSAPEGAVEEGGRWLVEGKAIFVAPSASHWLRQRRLRREGLLASGPVTVFADPQFEGRTFGDGPTTQTLPTLPATRREAEAISRLLGERAQIYLGAAATEQHLRSLAVPHAIIHFGTHSLITEGEGWSRSALLLTAGNEAEPLDDGRVEVEEFLDGLSLDCELAVLSSCKGGVSYGPFGFVQALQTAGTRTVLAALWPVADEGTAELMERLYRHLGAGEELAEALRAAQNELLRGEAGESLRSPYYWAGFRLHGDSR